MRNFAKFPMKKAMAMTTVVGLGLILVVLFILVLFIGNTANRISDESKSYGCKKSVEVAAGKMLGISATSLDFAELINCPTKYLTIDTADTGEASKKIADELRKCWWELGEGKLDIFQQQTATYCVVCSVIERWTGDKNVDGFIDWMNEHKVEGTQRTYLEYLTGTSKDYLSYSSSQGFTPMSIDTKQKYALVYVQAKDAYEWSTETQRKKAAQMGISATGVIKYSVAYLFGWDTSAKYDSRVVLVPYDQQNLKYVLGCEVLMD